MLHVCCAPNRTQNYTLLDLQGVAGGATNRICRTRNSTFVEDQRVRKDGAQERTRTFTAFQPLAPEASASTNSTTWAPGPPEAAAEAARTGRAAEQGVGIQPFGGDCQSNQGRAPRRPSTEIHSVFNAVLPPRANCASDFARSAGVFSARRPVFCSNGRTFATTRCASMCSRCPARSMRSTATGSAGLSRPTTVKRVQLKGDASLFCSSTVFRARPLGPKKGSVPF